MKKIILPIMILLSIGSYAQNIKLGFTGGLSVSNYHAKVDGNKETADSKAGIAAGVLIDIPVGKHFSFQPAINFVQKGTQQKLTFNNITEKTTLNVNYIEVPLNFLYNTNGRALNFFIGAGPSFAVAAGGRIRYTDGTNSVSENIKFGSSDDDMMKGVDIGANFTAGFSLLNGIMFTVNYNAGLNNLVPNGSDDGTVKSHYFGIKLGYLLNIGKRK